MKKLLLILLLVPLISFGQFARTSGNMMQALQGRVPGLYFRSGGDMEGSTGNELAEKKNSPPSVIIRGLSTLGDNSPLYVIDGISTKRQEVFASLSPESIESVQILKDAASSSIYGSRGANGVIIVTTKNKIKGTKGIRATMTKKRKSKYEEALLMYEVDPSIERAFELAEYAKKLFGAGLVNDVFGPILKEHKILVVKHKGKYKKYLKSKK